mgnify:CR=1 FL=1
MNVQPYIYLYCHVNIYLHLVIRASLDTTGDCSIPSCRDGGGWRPIEMLPSECARAGCRIYQALMLKRGQASDEMILFDKKLCNGRVFDCMAEFPVGQVQILDGSKSQRKRIGLSFKPLGGVNPHVRTEP